MGTSEVVDATSAAIRFADYEFESLH